MIHLTFIVENLLRYIELSNKRNIFIILTGDLNDKRSSKRD